MSLSGKGRILCTDSEAIGLLPDLRAGDRSSKHCIVCKDIETSEMFIFFDPYDMRDPANREWLEMEDEQDGDLVDGCKFLMEADVHVIQNGTGYDYLAFEKVFPDLWSFPYMDENKTASSDKYPNRVMDTLVMGQLLNPERRLPPQAYHIGKGNIGPNTIEAHGIRIGRYKPANEDWSKLTDHMIHRCSEDVEIGADLYNYLWKEWQEQAATPNGRTKISINTAYRLEMQFAFAMARQAQRGFRFHMKLALERCIELDAKLEETEKAFRPHMPPRVKKKKLTRVQRVGLAEAEHGEDYYLWDSEDQADAIEAQPEHGSELGTLLEITKKMSPKQWCLYTEKPDGISQKDWIREHPIKTVPTAGEFSAAVTKHYPECRGFVQDHKWPIVQGAFTPVRFEEIPLGNRDAVKQILYKYGWLGVNYNDTEQALVDNGCENELKPWAGKIDDDSLEAWRERENPPEWCLGIAAWYVISSRRNQILNKKDEVYYLANVKWPRQTNGKEQCRGILPRCRCKETGEEAQRFFEREGYWPTEGDWRAPAETFGIGTNTFRCRHKIVVNVPSRGLYPLRDLFIASEGKLVLGCDGAGLELRMLSHFLADAAYQEIVLNGDIHTHNQYLAGLPFRDMAKTFIYAFLYGSGIGNLARVCGMSEAAMQAKVNRFREELPALPRLVERIEGAGGKTGYLVAVDGRRGRIRSSDGKLLVHTMLNVLLQMTGSLCMKYGLAFSERQMIKESVGLDEAGFPAWLANVHDEVQAEVSEDEVLSHVYSLPKENWKVEEKRQHIDDEGRLWSAPEIIAESETGATLKVKRKYHRLGQIICEQMTHAGDFLKIRCPLAGEYKIGRSWAETH